MAFKAVNFDEAPFDVSVDAARETSDDKWVANDRVARSRRYDLASALRIVQAMETSPSRAAVFEEIKRKNRAYRLVDRLYILAGARLFQPLILFAYMLKCVLFLGPFGDRSAQAVAISQFPNEHKTMDRVEALAGQLRLMRVTFHRSHVLSRGQLAGLRGLVKGIGRVWPFLRALARRHSFMPSARIASALAFYLRFSQLFADRPDLAAAVVASNYSPEAVGMAAAAHRFGRKVIYANHAPVPANGAFVPPVLADCALFYGTETTRTYERRSDCFAEVAYIGQPGSARPMEWSETVSTVGIFLTAATKVETLRSLVATIRVDLPSAKIIIRQHPVTLLKTDFTDIGVEDSNVLLTIGNPLDDEIAACDLVICGNSGVAINVLSGGRPVAYLASLDALAFDTNGFVANRLVMSVPWWTEDIYERLRGFYHAPGWADVMRCYDAAYGADIALLHREAARTLDRYLRPRVYSNSDEIPVDQRRLIA
ncbi:MAG: hypothetical protein ACX930_05170 [Erythrobacter sp.]